MWWRCFERILSLEIMVKFTFLAVAIDDNEGGVTVCPTVHGDGSREELDRMQNGASFIK